MAKKQPIGLEVSVAACSILSFLKVHSQWFLPLQVLEARFGPATASALWELKELGLIQILWESLDGYPPYSIGGAALTRLGKAAIVPDMGRTPPD